VIIHPRTGVPVLSAQFYIEAPRSNSELPTPDLGEINLW